MRIKIYKKRGKNKEIKQKNGAKHVMSGSLLGVELKGIASALVGYLTILRMYPMDFEEFMIANQVSAATLDMLEEKWKASAPVIPLLASKSSNVFRLFSSDIGLLTSAYPAETKMELINKNGEVNNGAHFENVIAQQFYELKEMLGDDCIEVKKGCIVSVSAIFSCSGFAFRFFEIANAIHSCYSSFKAYFLLSCLSGGNNLDSAFK